MKDFRVKEKLLKKTKKQYDCRLERKKGMFEPSGEGST